MDLGSLTGFASPADYSGWMCLAQASVEAPGIETAGTSYSCLACLVHEVLGTYVRTVHAGLPYWNTESLSSKIVQ